MQLLIEPLRATGRLPDPESELTGEHAASLIAATSEMRSQAIRRLTHGLAADLPWSELDAAAGETTHRGRLPADSFYEFPDGGGVDRIVETVDGRVCNVSAQIDGSLANSEQLWLNRGNETRRLNTLQVRSLLASGGVLQVISLDEHESGVARLAADIESAFGATAQANLFVSDGSASGSGRHFDNPELFVVQLTGTKRWIVNRTTFDRPRRGVHDGDAPVPETIGAELFDGELVAGDVLYVPSGHWHLASPTGGPSAHVTIGMNRPTGADFLQWVATTAPWHQPSARGVIGDPSVLAADSAAWADSSMVDRFRRADQGRRPARAATSMAAARAFLAGDTDVVATSACPGGFQIVSSTSDAVEVWAGGLSLRTDQLGLALLAALARGSVDVDELDLDAVEAVSALAAAGLLTVSLA